MNKKGYIQLYYIIEMIIGIFVVSIMVYAAHSYATGTYDQKVYLANDIALATTAVASFPGNIEYFYPLEQFHFSYSFQGTAFSISDSSSALHAEKKSFLAPNTLSSYFLAPPGILISKQG